MKRRFLVVLCAAMLLVATVGCGGSGASTSDPVSSDSQGSTTTTTGSAVEISVPDKVIDEVVWPEIEVTNQAVKYLWWCDPSMLENPNTWVYRMNETLKTKYNCHLEFVYSSYEELPTKAAQLVLSGNSPDMIVYKPQDYPNFLLKELVQPVDDYLDFTEEHWAKVKDINDQYMWNGKHYLVVPSLASNYITLYWKSLFDDAGLKTPEEYYKEGNWTWDTMLDLATKLTSDTDGDGYPDVWGFATHPTSFFQTTGEDLITIENGVITNNLRSANLARSMKFLFDAGPDKHNVRTTDLTKWETLFPRGQLAMLINEDYVQETYIELIREGKVGVAPPPKDPESDQWYVPGKIEAVWIPKNASNVNGAIAYMTVVMMSDQDPDMLAWSRNLKKEMYNLTDEQCDMLREIKTEATLVYPKYLGMGNFGNKSQWELFGELYTWNFPWESQVEKYYPVLQADIDSVKDAYLAAKK